MTIDINSQNSVFLFIDIQEKLLGMLKEKIAESCKKNSIILAKMTNILNIKSIITEQYPKGLGETISEIKEIFSQSAEFFEKTDFSALNIENIETAFENKKNIFVFGIETHICVFQTAIDLLKKEYNVFIIKNACASREKEEHKTALNLLEKEGAKIITTEMVVFEMLKTSKHPNFKEIQALIK